MSKRALCDYCDKMLLIHSRTADGKGLCSNCHTRTNVSRLFNRYGHDARRRGLSFSISLESFDCLVHQPCMYCGTIDDNLLNGVDRVDGNKGYFTINCVPCCGTCNMMRGKLSIADFVDQIDKIAARM